MLNGMRLRSNLDGLALIASFFRPASAALCLGLVASCSNQITMQPAQASIEQEFQLQVINHQIARQEGRTVNLFLRYRYRRDLAATEYPDWAKVHAAAVVGTCGYGELAMLAATQ